MSKQRTEKTRYPGIVRAHGRRCESDGACRCGYQAMVFSARERKRIYKHFDNLAAARTWREDVSKALRDGKLKLDVPKTTVAQAGVDLIAGMRSGAIYDKSGKRYKPSSIRSYERALRLYIVPALGGRPVAKLERRDIRPLVERMQAAGLSASTIQNTMNPLQVMCRRLVDDSQIAVDPTDGLKLPRVTGRRDKVATRTEARALIDALPASERAMWATAFYGGLRRGELRAMRWSDVDLACTPALIHVRRTWDDEEGEVDVKTDAGFRSVPLTGQLRAVIVEHGLATCRSATDLVFGRTATLPFIPSTVRTHALKAWKAANDKAAKAALKEGRDVRPDELLRPLTPHEARHCCASYLIEANLNDLELTATIGHSDPRTTKTIYGHLFADSGASIAAKMDAYLGGSAV